MNQPAKNGLLAASLALAGVLSHALPHPMGVSTVGAIGMVAAAYLPRRLMLVPVFVTVLLVDAMNGFYSALAMSFVYTGHLFAAVAARPALRRIGFTPVAFAAVASAVVFYLISNITPMAMGFYPNTVEGWIACYVAGLPFLLKGALANAIYGGAAFGIIALTGVFDADRFAAAKRH
ncbi:DUF6580 family putative transport protein [Parasphingorhabdus cellanae]|uniref:Uncharacterized protein n=1 Tax=Parasphingorhabdus cellanae TaxID=2806553 RepID=A0ABX7T5N6_9SPHN|nr:DUF6580 family putative transport protein [Parasphingorhabdus cellanae]QTD56890.1 hypothetical protein J4G78_04770 [Parasphingorhabdus cellanae]